MSQGCSQVTLSTEVTQRFSLELNSSELCVGELPKQMGNPKPHLIRNFLRGNILLPADLLAQAAIVGNDTIYVITGQHKEL